MSNDVGRESSNIQINPDLIYLLVKGGISQNAARVLISLFEQSPSDVTSLKKSCGISQPEVSIGISELDGLGIVGKKIVHSSGRGRPRHQYVLLSGIDKILILIIERAQRSLEKLNSGMKELEEIVASIRN